MSRGLATDLLTELAKKSVNICGLVEMYFDSGSVFLWTGYGNKTYGSTTYVGTGALMGIGGIKDTAQTRSDSFQITLSGIPTTYTSLALSEHFQGRKFKFFITSIKSDGTLATPFCAFRGQMDTMILSDSKDTCSIVLNVENRFNRLFTPDVQRYTDQDQRINYPDDGFFKYVAGMQGQLTDWGKISK